MLVVRAYNMPRNPEQLGSPEGREFKEHLAFAVELAKKAGVMQMDYYDRAHAVEWTARHHFRTEVDVAIGRLVREEIGKRFPDHRISSEEQADKETGSEFRWVVDELDGTIPYARGTTDHFSFSIALCRERNPVIGVVNAPKRGELYTAVKGGGAFCNGVPIRVSNLLDINQAFMGVDAGKTKRTSHLPYLEKLLGVDGVTCDQRTGAAAVPLCLVASGKLDALLATQLNPEDMAAAVVLIREAGGKVTSLAGVEADETGGEWMLGNKTILAANPELHKKLTAFLTV